MPAPGLATVRSSAIARLSVLQLGILSIPPIQPNPAIPPILDVPNIRVIPPVPGWFAIPASHARSAIPVPPVPLFPTVPPLPGTVGGEVSGSGVTCGCRGGGAGELLLVTVEERAV
jgi:hypothetical protein